VPQVGLDGLLAEEQLGGDLAVGLTGPDELGDLQFAAGERGGPAAAGPLVAPTEAAKGTLGVVAVPDGAAGV
jgi:hypothetical protein